MKNYTCPQCQSINQSIIQPAEDSHRREVKCHACGYCQPLKYLNNKANK